MIKAVLWDVMDTLVYDPFREVVTSVTNMDLTSYFDAKSRQTYLDFEKGNIHEKTYAANAVRGHHIDMDALKAAFREGYRWLDGMEDLCADLHAADMPMFALSNYSTLYTLMEDKLQLGRFLSWRYVSCHTGIRKPDPEAYLAPARELGLLPEQILFVDDREKNIRGAHDVGMQAFLFQGAEHAREQLTALGALGTAVRGPRAG